ncbi:recombinase RecQ [Bacillus sp. VT 712]|uniref:ATP-dependent DNA helicase RecQ n=1 Tax=Priestia veravalensis TaxID=1414648 RepID=A0A0V8JRP5_9BACI|nr:MULTISPECIES: ATP-dependent DNA helicase RecQ [Bacillaceae]KSU89533.1 recombinase RecQ [Priestia veravalensis]KZB92588.1 recombinase RecQ [Bacillus sp. VT 712]SCB80954.1 ATP-dependent DNA helicase RecQ [Priestia flexa]
MELEQVLQKEFGFSTFRNGQKEIITDLLNNNHVLAVLPTGTGKSLCYQLPGYFLKRPILIVSPLLSLMEDQVQQLKAKGEKRVIALNSFLREDEKRQALRSLNSYRFIYASPEILQNPYVVQALKQANIGMFVVDEAHCISQWGHDFRLDYLNLGMVWENLGKPTCLALTGTATSEVLSDIKTYLHLDQVNEHLYSMNRSNIAISVEHVHGLEEKKKKLLEYVTKIQKPGIIYCSSRALTESLTHYLKENGVEKVQYYHGGMEANDRMLIQRQFLENQLDFICCTSAFGMGVNKSNVRFVLHFQTPTQLESYVQEIGRGGRDGLPSLAILLYSEEDDGSAQALLDLELPSPDTLLYCLSQIRSSSSPVGVRDVEAHFLFTIGVYETHWRFIRHYLENIGAIHDGIIYPEQVTESLYGELVEIVNKRLNVKQKKYHAMKGFIHTKECRRKALMRYFEEEGISERHNCCDLCSIDLDEFKQSEHERTESTFLGWQAELARLLKQDVH